MPGPTFALFHIFLLFPYWSISLEWGICSLFSLPRTWQHELTGTHRTASLPLGISSRAETSSWHYTDPFTHDNWSEHICDPLVWASREAQQRLGLRQRRKTRLGRLLSYLLNGVFKNKDNLKKVNRWWDHFHTWSQEEIWPENEMEQRWSEEKGQKAPGLAQGHGSHHSVPISYCQGFFWVLREWTKQSWDKT